MDLKLVHAGVVFEDGKARFKEINGYIQEFIKFSNEMSLSTDYKVNDFELVLSKNEYKKRNVLIGDWIYIPNSEFGGRVEDIRHEDDMIYLSGPNFRFYLGRTVVYPPFVGNGRTDYLRIDKVDANQALIMLKDSTVVKNVLPFYKIKNDLTGTKVSGQFRYAYFNDAANKLLSANDMRLKITHSYIDDAPLIVSAEKKVDRMEKLNKDYDIKIGSEINETNNISFMVGLGQGNLQDRTVVFMKRNEDNTIEEVSLNTTVVGMNQVNEYIYDNPNAESVDELKKGMLEKFDEKITTKTITVKVADNLELDLGDVLYACDEVTNLSITVEVNKKTLTIQNGTKKINYEVGEI